ncbi:hypothetical protein Rsub_10430 [Raphidocelis subcapitata]|uniref:Right handed beta helix domain-containing protein n=1 Tax=Raphidocelis subcapitata TaxID=307507 RepID=A0A2V0PJL7_9CHLO|nr:hypothetical protein Rsub_10430 [Raphidocelis subcapitata]|eukprot:GBF97507.1 hypothetical protein Rsub_10430 [Raphidocelis subcapitata]
METSAADERAAGPRRHEAAAGPPAADAEAQRLRAQAEEALASGRHGDAMAAARAGAALVANPHKRDALFRDLSDRIALAAAARGGAAAGFPGRLLTVRPADPDTAWLGLPAPADGGDGAAAPGSRRALPAPQGWRAGGPAAGQTRPQLFFRCLEDALGAAADGDVIELLPGTHNVRAPGGLRLDRRVLIGGGGGEGGGLLGRLGGAGQEGPGVGAGPAAALIDYRGNAPLFRISRPCVLSRIEVDMVGFAPAVAIDGPASLAPLLAGCRVACSGGDAVLAGGAAAPTLLNCSLTGCKAGLHLHGTARATLRACALEGCGDQGALLQEGASAELDGCEIRGCGAEGVAASGEAALALRGCLVSACGGPAVDASGAARARLGRCRLSGCCGGLWLWGVAEASARACRIEGGASFAVLLDGAARAASGGGNSIDGPTLLPAAPGPRPLATAAAKASAARGHAPGAGSGGGGGAATEVPLVPQPCAAARDVRVLAAAFPTESGPFVVAPRAFAS